MCNGPAYISAYTIGIHPAYRTRSAYAVRKARTRKVKRAHTHIGTPTRAPTPAALWVKSDNFVLKS